VLAGGFAPLWFVWVALVNVAIYLYFSLFPGIWGFFFSVEALLLASFLFNIAALALWEFAARRVEWLRGRWAVRLISTIAGVNITGLLLQTIFDWHDTSGWWCVLYPLWLVAMYVCYRFVVRDLYMLSGMCLSGIVIIAAILTRLLLNSWEAMGFLLIAMAVVGLSATSAYWLKRVHREMENDGINS
jgi:hypothetical protein